MVYFQPPENGTREDWLPKSGEGYSQCEMFVDASDRTKGRFQIHLPIKNKQKLYVFFRSHFIWLLNASSFFAGVTDCINGYEFHFENAHEWNIVSEWGLVCRYVKDMHVTGR